MSTTTPTLPEQPIVPASHTSSVVMGQTSYLSVLFRLAAMELYKFRRRTLSKVLAIIGIVTIILTFSGVAIYAGVQTSTPASQFAPVLCSQISKSIDPNCLDHQPTQVELAHYKQASIQNTADRLSLPGSLNLIVKLAVLLSLLTPLIIILAGAIVGGEYSFGTIRLLFTRGPERVQFLLAKMLAIAICTLVGLLGIMLIGVLLGYAFHPISGLALDASFFNAAWLGHTALIVLISILGWFMYAMIALLFGTLGRSTVAGIVGGITWLFMEIIVGGILTLVAGIVGGDLGTFLKAIPDYFIGNNINALVQNQNYYIGNGTIASPISDTHSLLVLAGYLIVSIALSCWLTIKRDVTH